jgi:hypothetical protein
LVTGSSPTTSFRGDGLGHLQCDGYEDGIGRESEGEDAEAHREPVGEQSVRGEGSGRPDFSSATPEPRKKTSSLGSMQRRRGQARGRGRRGGGGRSDRARRRGDTAAVATQVTAAPPWPLGQARLRAREGTRGKWEWLGFAGEREATGEALIHDGEPSDGRQRPHPRSGARARRHRGRGGRRPA